MKDDLKTRLLANVILSHKSEPPRFRLPQKRLTPGSLFSILIAVLAAVGLLLLLIASLKPLL